MITHMTNTHTVGTCSLCGGRVSVPAIWHSITPAVPTCDSCGAMAAQYGPTIPMQPAPKRMIGTSTTGDRIILNDWVTTRS